MAGGVENIVLLLLASLTRSHGATVVEHRQPVLRGNEIGQLSQNSSPSCTSLVNRGTFSTVDIAVGTPAQAFSVVADTGSDSVIIPSCVCKESGSCAESSRCFTGAGASSSFDIEDGPDGPPGAVLTFGSGPIEVAISSDVVRVGQVEGIMEDSLMLMLDQDLDFGGPFEGILGLGLPVDMRPTIEARAGPASESSTGVGEMDEITLQDIMQGILGEVPSLDDVLQDEDASSAKGFLLEVERFHDHELRASPIQSTSLLQSASRVHSKAKVVDDDEEQIGLVSMRLSPSVNETFAKTRKPYNPDEETGFLKRAGVSRFSICFNDGEDGALRLNPPKAKHIFENVGREHWAVDMRGVSIGESTSRLGFCGTEDMREGQQTPCGAIPDSGTTAITAPQEHLDMLFESLCDGWDRCRRNHTAMVEAASAASNAAKELYNLDPFGIEPVHKKDIFQLLLLDCNSWLESSEMGLDELPPIRFGIRGANGTDHELEMTAWSYVYDSGAQADGTPRKCEAAFSPMEFNTDLNGPVWIFGTPFFYMFEIGYDMTRTSPGISFTSLGASSCGTCGTESTAALVSAGTENTKTKRLQPRRQAGPLRRPSIDVSRPL